MERSGGQGWPERRAARVFIHRRAALAVHEHCRREVPNEALGKLYGYRRTWQGARYVRITRTATAPLESGPTHARFTPEATRACQEAIERNSGPARDRPVELGVYHSHPFGVEPHFSSTDRETFLDFPYDTPGNVFILVDPLTGWFKVYVLAQDLGAKSLLASPWTEYWVRP